MGDGSFLELDSFGRPLPPASPEVSLDRPVLSEMLAVAELNVRVRFVGLGSIGFHSRNLFLVPLPSSGRLLTGVVSKDGRGVRLRRHDLIGVRSPVGFLRAPEVSGVEFTIESIRHTRIITK